VHRGVGFAATLCASLVGLSPLYAKQHYILDVIAGVLLACVAYAVFLRNYPCDAVPQLDRRVAPLLALVIIGIIGICYCVAYQLSGKA
jgi:hypothetical protein